MLYMIVGQDGPDSLPKRQEVRSEHIARLQVLVDQGRLVLAGPNPAIDSADPGSAGFTGSLIVAEFPTLEAAREWADADPYVKSGVYSAVTVEPFKKVLP